MDSCGPTVGPGPGHLGVTAVTHRDAGRPMEGWRYWHLDGDRLCSVTHRRVLWAPGQALQAACQLGGHAAPDPGCACGFHAGASLDDLIGAAVCMGPTVPLVIGTVSMWGTVVVDDHGLRGEWVRPARLSLVEGTGPPGDGWQAAALAALALHGVAVGTLPVVEAVGEVSATMLAFQRMSG